MAFLLSLYTHTYTLHTLYVQKRVKIAYKENFNNIQLKTMPIKNGVVFHVNDGDAETVWTCRLSGKNELTFDQVRKPYNFQITRPKSEISLSVCSLESNLSNGVTFFFLSTSGF